MTRDEAHPPPGQDGQGGQGGQGGPDRQPGGRRILLVDAVGTAAFAATATLEAILFRHWTQVLGVTVALGLFVVGCLAFLAGYAQAVQRSRTQELSVTGLYLLAGPAVPGRVKRVLGLLLATQVAVALVTAGVRTFTPLAFGVLVPVFGLGLNGLWAARHGTFPPRRARGSAAEHHSEGGMEQNAGHG